MPYIGNKPTNVPLSSADLPDNIVTSAKIADDAVDSDQLASGAVDDAHLATGIASSKLSGALPALDASSLTSIPAANITGTLPAISGASLTNLDARDLENALPAISGASLTSLPSTAEVYGGAFYNVSINTPGAYTITGVGFQPDVLWVSQIANRAGPGVSYGFADSTEEGCFCQYNSVGTADTWDDQQPHLFKLYSSSGNSAQATLTSMNADGFTYTITETGTYTTADGTMMFIAWKV